MPGFLLKSSAQKNADMLRVSVPILSYLYAHHGRLLIESWRIEVIQHPLLQELPIQTCSSVTLFQIWLYEGKVYLKAPLPITWDKQNVKGVMLFASQPLTHLSVRPSQDFALRYMKTLQIWLIWPYLNREVGQSPWDLFLYNGGSSDHSFSMQLDSGFYSHFPWLLRLFRYPSQAPFSKMMHVTSCAMALWLTMTRRIWTNIGCEPSFLFQRDHKVILPARNRLQYFAGIPFEFRKLDLPAWHRQQ